MGFKISREPIEHKTNKIRKLTSDWPCYWLQLNGFIGKQHTYNNNNKIY